MCGNFLLEAESVHTAATLQSRASQGTSFHSLGGVLLCLALA